MMKDLEKILVLNEKMSNIAEEKVREIYRSINETVGKKLERERSWLSREKNNFVYDVFDTIYEGNLEDDSYKQKLIIPTIAMLVSFFIVVAISIRLFFKSKSKPKKKKTKK